MVMAMMGIIFVGGCITRENVSQPVPISNNESEKAIYFCIAKCKDLLKENTDLSNGPCLLNPVTEVQDWVCDVVHNPRSQIDNLPENQCPAYRKLAKHFVEVDENCNLIRAV